MKLKGRDSSEENPSPEKRVIARRIRVLWFGVVLYALIIVNAVRYARLVPLKFLLLGDLVNVAMIIFFIVTLKRAYKELRK